MLDILLIIAVLVVVPPLVFRKFISKKRCEIQGHVACLWRTKKGLKFITKLSKYERFWDIFTELGIIFCFGIFSLIYLIKSKRMKTWKAVAEYGVFLGIAFIIAASFFMGRAGIMWDVALSLFIGGFGIFAFYMLIIGSAGIIMSYLVGGQPIPGIMPIIPGVQIPGAPLYFPIHALIAMIVLVVVHEVAHGIVAKREKIKVKSFGILTLGIFPVGAFTEPDEEQLKKTVIKKRINVLSAGSMANFVTGLVFLIIFTGLFYGLPTKFIQDPQSTSPGFFVPWTDEYVEYYQIVGIVNNSAAMNAGITNGMKIYNYNLLFEEQTPFGEIVLHTDQGDITAIRDSNGLLGITFQIAYAPYPTEIWVQKYVIETVFWIMVLNFIVGMVNFLPFAIFDGARIFQDLVYFYLKKGKIKKAKKRARNAMIAVTILILLLLVVNALPYFV